MRKQGVQVALDEYTMLDIVPRCQSQGNQCDDRDVWSDDHRLRIASLVSGGSHDDE
jgi:hypothetical protein